MSGLLYVTLVALVVAAMGQATQPAGSQPVDTNLIKASFDFDIDKGEIDIDIEGDVAMKAQNLATEEQTKEFRNLLRTMMRSAKIDKESCKSSNKTEPDGLFYSEKTCQGTFTQSAEGQQLADLQKATFTLASQSAFFNQSSAAPQPAASGAASSPRMEQIKKLNADSALFRLAVGVSNMQLPSTSSLLKGASASPSGPSANATSNSTSTLPLVGVALRAKVKIENDTQGSSEADKERKFFSTVLMAFKLEPSLSANATATNTSGPTAGMVPVRLSGLMFAHATKAEQPRQPLQPPASLEAPELNKPFPNKVQLLLPVFNTTN